MRTKWSSKSETERSQTKEEGERLFVSMVLNGLNSGVAESSGERA